MIFAIDVVQVALTITQHTVAHLAEVTRLATEGGIETYHLEGGWRGGENSSRRRDEPGQNHVRKGMTKNSSSSSSNSSRRRTKPSYKRMRKGETKNSSSSSTKRWDEPSQESFEEILP